MEKIIRPRLIDHFGIMEKQSNLDFAIPFLYEDIPLYVDPFLMWKSPSQQDQSLHESLLTAFNNIGKAINTGKKEEIIYRLCRISECDEVGLGNSETRKGKPIGRHKANEILELFNKLPHFHKGECEHIEEIQLYIDAISKDRISDFACNFVKSFLIDFTIDQCENLSIPMKDTVVSDVYVVRERKFIDDYKAKLPFNPETNQNIIFIPKRWLRYVPWINYEDYFKSYCPQDDIAHEAETLNRVKVLQYNINNYGIIDDYLKEKERTFEDCKADPLFSQIPVISAKRQYTKIKKLPSGKENNVDKEYEKIIEFLLPSLLYPHLDFATAQSRTLSGSSIRDLIFYNNRSHPFLLELFNDYQSRQITFELKNVEKVEREHIDQLNRYLAPGLGHFGVIVTRNELSKARLQQTVDLWSAQRKAIITLTDIDIDMMVQVFESEQRLPLEIINKKYFEFRQKCPV